MLLSFAPIVLLVFLLFSAVQLFGADASYGPNQVALLIASAAAGLVGMYRGLTWAEVQAVTGSLRTPVLRQRVRGFGLAWRASG